jgi:type II secretion system protein D
MHTATRLTDRCRSTKWPGVCAVAVAMLVALAPVSAQSSDAPEESAPPAEAPQDSTPTENTDKPQEAAADDGAEAARAADVARREQLRDLLHGLDPAMFNTLIGAEIDIEVVGGQIILQGPKDAVDKLEMLIRMIDTVKERKVVEVVTVFKRDANEIARSLAADLAVVLREPNQLPDDDVTITAISPNLILVSALPKHIDFVVNTIHQVDDLEDPLGPVEHLVFSLKHRRASDVAEQMKDILQKIRQRVGASGAKAEIQVIPNNANNSIMVIAPESERERLQELINTIDVEPVRGWGETKLVIYPLIHSKARELSEVIKGLLASEQAGDRRAAEELIQRLIISKSLPTGELVELPPIDLQKPTKIIPDEGTNSLIVATVEENVGSLGELIRLLDTVPMAADVGIKIFPLRFADAETVVDTLRQMFDEGKKLTEDPDGSGQGGVPEVPLGKALVYNIGLAADARTNTIIASGREEQLVLVQMIVSEVDRPATSLKFPLRLVPLDYADASRVAGVLKELFDKRLEAAEATGADRSARERERVFMTVDIRTNSILVSASEENLTELRSIVQQLDTKPARVFDQIRVVPCLNLAAADIKLKIDELWRRKADLRREQELSEDLPIVVVDDRSNSIVVASSIEDFEEITGLVATLQDQPRVDDIELFKLEYADAAVVAGMVEQLMEGLQSASEAFKAPTIMPDPRSNALVVAGTRDAMERVADVVRRLDVEAGPLTAVFAVYPLHYGSSSKLAPRMQELFDSRRDTQDRSGTPIVILPDETSNSLVVSASRDDHDIVKGLLAMLDQPSTLARQFEIFPLRMAKAAKVAETLENLFQSQAAGTGGSGRADAISAVADERTNSLIVWASPGEMQNIREVMARLDTSEPVVEMMVKVVQLKQALATDFAELLRRTLLGEGQSGTDAESAVIVSFLERDDRGRETVRRLLRQDIQIEPDPRTNSLMLMAPADSMAMLETMIRDFDRIRPITSEIRLFNLINSDAETMVERLETLFAPQAGAAVEGETKTQLVFGSRFEDLDLATVGQELRFAADPRTNTLIVAGSPVYLSMVEDLVTFLDAQEAEDRVVQVVNAKYRPATDLASAVRSFIDQEIAVLGEGDDQESRQRRMERQVSVEAIGSAEEGSSSLVVGTSRRAYDRTMRMINELDRPEPQVMISVTVAEVTLRDEVELGVEIAGQDLTFSKSAVVGPNGIIEGSDFDFVAGTALSAIGSGQGFNFTMTGEDFSFLFHALQINDRLEVLSRPILMVRNGEEGNITIADSVPIVESTRLADTGQTQSTIGREDVGIILTATPQISPDGYVTIALTQEISNISGENIQLTEGVSSPVFSTRQVTTNVTVRDGETVVIGGLIQTRESIGENKVPILGDLPVIGFLFRSSGVSKSRTELLLVLTVDILRSDEDVRSMSIAQRDTFGLTDSILQSPLMGRLRITPDQAGMGPRSGTEPEREGDRELRPLPNDRDLYGPKPRIYGPKTPGVTTTRADQPPADSASRPTYGPVATRKEVDSSARLDGE